MQVGGRMFILLYLTKQVFTVSSFAAFIQAAKLETLKTCLVRSLVWNDEFISDDNQMKLI